MGIQLEEGDYMDNKKHLVLVGGGHSHLVFLKNFKYNKERLKITMISDDSLQYYSGMLSGYLMSKYTLEESTVNLETVCSQLNINLVLEKAVSIDPKEKDVILLSGRKIRYDLLSVNTGSKSMLVNTPSVGIRPIKNMMLLKNEILKGLHLKISVIGSGAAAIEVATSLNIYPKVQVTLMLSDHMLLKGVDRRAVSKAIKLVEKNGLKIDRSISPDLSEYDHVVVAKGISSTMVLDKEYFNLDAKGFPYVDDNLRLMDYESIFGAGDGVTVLSKDKMPKNGFYAISQGNLLCQNITAYLDNKPMKSYEPRSSHLAIIPVDQEVGIITFGSIAFCNRWCIKLKKQIDVKYMKRIKTMEAPHA